MRALQDLQQRFSIDAVWSHGEAYHAEMSGPVTAYESCSRLSPHLA